MTSPRVTKNCEQGSIVPNEAAQWQCDHWPGGGSMNTPDTSLHHTPAHTQLNAANKTPRAGLAPA